MRRARVIRPTWYTRPRGARHIARVGPNAGGRLVGGAHVENRGARIAVVIARATRIGLIYP